MSVALGREMQNRDAPPHILLFTCHYGSGHLMAAQGIVERLPDYTVEVVDMYEGPLRPLDWVRRVTPRLTASRIYNHMAQQGQTRALNGLGYTLPKLFLGQQKRIEALLTPYIEQRKPDLIISCIPLVTPMLRHVSQALHIPLLVVTTDVNPSAFCYGLHADDIPDTQHTFRMTIAYGPEGWDYLSRLTYTPDVARAFQYHFGYPTRKAFSEPADPSLLQAIREAYGITPEETLIVMMGSVGKHASLYAQLLLSMKEEEVEEILGWHNSRRRIYLLCLCGDEQKKETHQLMHALNGLQKTGDSARVRVRAFPSTPKIAELASLPELMVVIAKPGGGTVNEMIKKKIPMLYHMTQEPLYWERGNMEYGEARHLGLRCHAPRGKGEQAKRRFASLLRETYALRHAILAEEHRVPEADLDFSHNLRTTVAEMLQEDQ